MIPAIANIAQVQLPFVTNSATTGENIVIPRETVLTIPNVRPCRSVGVSSTVKEKFIAEVANAVILIHRRQTESIVVSQRGMSVPGLVSLSAINRHRLEAATAMIENRVVYAYFAPI